MLLQIAQSGAADVASAHILFPAVAEVNRSRRWLCRTAAGEGARAYRLALDWPTGSSGVARRANLSPATDTTENATLPSPLTQTRRAAFRAAADRAGRMAQTAIALESELEPELPDELPDPGPPPLARVARLKPRR